MRGNSRKCTLFISISIYRVFKEGNAKHLNTKKFVRDSVSNDRRDWLQ